MQVVPDARGDEVPQRIGVVVDHHLRFAGGAGREEDQQRVRGPGPVHAGEVDQLVGAGRGVVELDGVADPSVPRAVGHEFDEERGAVFLDLLDLLRVLRHRDDHPDVGGLDTVFQVFGGQHRRRGAVDGADLDERDDEDPPFRRPRKHQHDPVALLDAVLYAHIDGLI